MAFKFDDDYEEYRKKRKKEEQEVRTQQAKQNFENYTNAKKQSMQEMSSAIQERNKKQEEAKKKREEELNKVNQEFRSQYPQTVSQNNKQQQKLPIANFTLTSKDEKESKIKRVDSTALFKLSNGAIDTRSEGKKTIDDIMAITGNVYESAKNVIPSSVEFINKVNEYATKKVGEKSVSNILGNNETAKIAGQVIGSKIGEQIHNNINPIADINNSINNEEVKKKREEKIQANISATSNPLAKKLAEISSSVGQNAIPMAVSMVNPIVGTALFITSAGGNYLNEAEKLGMSEGQSLAYATVMAGIEGGSESFISTKFINNAIKKVGLKGLSNEILHSTGINIGENFVQEWATEYIDEYAKSLISIDSKDDVWNALKGQGEYADWEGIHARALQSGIDGILSAVILNGASLGVTSAVDVVQGKSSDIQKAFNDSKKVVDMNEIKDGVGKAVQNSLKNEIMNVKNQPIPATQQIAQQENKTAQDGNIEQNIANNQETLYNNFNGSESGVNENNKGNEPDDRRRVQRLFDLYKRGQENDRRSNERIQENQGQQITQSTIKKELINYANKNKKSNLSPEEAKIQKIFEKLGGNAIFYEYGGDNFFLGLSDTNNVYIDSLSDENINNIAYHELIHFLRQNKNEIYIKEIQPIVDKIATDFDYQEAIFNYAKSSEGFEIGNLDFTKQQELAEEIIANISANIYGDLEVNYELLDEDINSIKSSIDKILNENNTEEKTITRHDIIQRNRNIARENIKNISTWNDKSKGLSYQLETMERNMYDIIPDKAEAKQMNDTYFEPIHLSEAEKQRFINKYNDRIKEFNLNKHESEAVQFLGEKKYNPDFHKGSQEDIQTRNEIQSKIDENIKNGKINQEKVDNAIEEFRKIYDELFELENKVLRENGYEEKPYRKGYFPHFIDYVPETKTEKVLDKLGFKIDKRPLPTDIAGITEQFVPGKTWNRSALERKGNKTDYNALKGFDTYIAQAADNIFHTENIQKLRGLENEIRYQYSDKGVQERIDNILNDETLYEDEKQGRIDRILEQVSNPMPNLVTELRRYTNALANKKSEADRSIENMMGREIYSTVNAIENRFGANAVGLNIGSALTNFIPITQAYSQVSTKNMGRAMIDTVKSYINDDGFIDNSTFLTNRLKQAEKLYKTGIEKASDKANLVFRAVDEVTSNIVIRAKYLENIENGMKDIEAMKNADEFARKVIGDRSKGSLPTKFEEKNPVSKMFTQFQLEVNNQYRYIFKDIPRDLAEKGLQGIALAFLKMFIASWLYNEASEKITGRKPAFSPIDIAISSYKTITNEEQKTAEKIIKVGKETLEQIPFVGAFFGGGRVPVSGAIPNPVNLTKAGIGLVTGEMDSKKAVNTLGKEVSKPLYYLLPPFGGGQIKKSIEGVKTVAQGGSYGVDSKGEETLQFPVENPNAGDYIKASIFGKYSLPLAKDYVNSGYKSLNAKDTKGYKETKIPYKEFITYTNSKLTKKEDKIGFINNMNISEEQKWDMYCYDIFDNTTREKDKGSQLEDARYAVSNGITKKEYLELYNSVNSRKMSMPTKEENKELKANGIKLKNYMDFSIKVHDETKKQKANGELKENGQLKNKDKISILLGSQYNENEKKAIYSNYINKEDKKIELVNKLGIPLEEYLKYKTQEFENDKDEYGETISGSKKQKVESYLNNILDKDLSLIHKKILYKVAGYSTDTANNNFDKDIVNYINGNNKLNEQDRIELLEIIGFDVDKEGKIKTTTILPIKKYVK